MDLDTTNAQFQSIAGVRGFATSKVLRNELVREGCVEPLILATGNEGCLVKDIEVRREAAAAMYNLALSPQNGIRMAQSGVVGALISLMSTNDVVGQVYAIGTLANLAERESKVQSKLINDGCLAPLICHIENGLGNVETRREISRCFALFAYNSISHDQLMCHRLLKCILKLTKMEQNMQCRRYCVHTLANLSIFESNHNHLIQAGVMRTLNELITIKDVEIKRCVAFAFHNMTKNRDTHEESEKTNVAKSLAALLDVNDYFTQLHCCLSLKYLTVSVKARAQFVESGGLHHLFLVADSGDNEQKREVAAVLKNISISDRNKVLIVKDRGVEVLTYFCRLSDEKLCHQACGVLANLAEVPDNQEVMMKEGILHHLKFIMRSKSDEILRESLRAIANLSSDLSCCEMIPNDGGLFPLISSLSSDDLLCRRFATMAISNLATVSTNRNPIIEEGGIQPLLDIAADFNSPEISRRYAFVALTNLSASKTHHETLVECGIISLCCTNMESADTQLRTTAVLCLSNLASNKCNHVALQQASCIQRFMPLLNGDERDVLLRAVSFFRGLSANVDFCNILLQEDLIQNLLTFTLTQDVEIQTDALAILCNLSLGGYISDDPEKLMQKVDVEHLLSFLCSSNATCRLFGAISIGNIVSDVDLQDSILDGGSLNPLIHVANTADLETQRCIAYALCNLCRVEKNRSSIVEEGGLLPIFSLAYSNDICDVFTAVSAIRGLANTDTVRRVVVIHGGLEPLFHTLEKSQHSQSKNQVLAAIAALSLDDENKTAIVNNANFHQIKNLSILNDFNQTLYSLRVLANCAEHSALHIVLSENLFDFVLGCHHLSNIHISKEISRLYVNLSSNLGSLDTLVEMNITENILDMLKIENDTVIKNCVMSIHNLSVDSRHHATIFCQGLVDFLINCCLIECPSTGLERSKIRRYSSLVLGNLLRSKYGFQNFFTKNIVHALENTLEDSDLETRFNATFGFHQFGTKFHELMLLESINSEIVDNHQIETNLLKYIRSTPQKLHSHALSTLRLLSSQNSSSFKIVKNHGFETLSFSCKEVASEEIRREIAATFCHLTMPCDNQLEVVNSNAIKCLFHLLSFSDTETARFAIGALANIAEHQSTHNILLEEGIVQILIKKSYDKRLSIKRESSRGLSNILTSNQAHEIFFENYGLESIDSLSGTIDAECQYSTSVSLHKLASREQNHEFMILSGIQHPIFILSKLQHNLPASRQALSALRELSSNRRYKVFIAEKGGLQTAQDLLLSDDLDIQVLAASTIQHLSISSLLKQRICSNGTLDVIISCSRDSDDKKLLSNCAGVLSNLSEHPKVQTLFWTKQIVDVLAKINLFPSAEVQEQLARTINFITSTQNLNQYDDDLLSKIMEVAIRLLSIYASKNASLEAFAAATIGNIAIDDNKQRMLCKLGAFQPLIILLNSTQTSCRLNSCRSISRLLVSYENKLICAGNKRLVQNLINLLHDEGGVARFAIISLCNLSTCEKAHECILENDGIRALLSLISNANPEDIVVSVKTLCNLGRNRENQKRIVHEGGIAVLSSLLQLDNAACIETATLALSNLCADREFNAIIISTGALHFLAAILADTNASEKQVAAAKIVYNLSTTEDCHVALAKPAVADAVKKLCKSESASCRLSAIMTLCNLSANKITRSEAIRNGGLQAAVVMLKDSHDACKINACTCLTNMSNNQNTQKQIVLHGGLPLLTQNLLQYDNSIVQKSSIICIINLASNVCNHEPILRQGTYHYLTELAKSDDEELKVFCAFTICNLLSNDSLLEHIGSCDGISPLLTLGKSNNAHCQCISLGALRRLASTSQNRKRLMEMDVLKITRKNGFANHSQIQQEVAALLCNLSRDGRYMSDIAQLGLSVVNYLMKGDNPDTIAHAVGTLGNIAEDSDYHQEIEKYQALTHLLKLVQSEFCDVRREAVRAISNLLSSSKNHRSFTMLDLSPLVELTGDDDNECQYNAVLSCRKLIVNEHVHDILLVKGLKNFFSLLTSESARTKIHVAGILRDLCAKKENQKMIVAQGGIVKILILLRSAHMGLKSFGMACLRHLSCNDSLKRTIMSSDAVELAVNNILGASSNLLRQIAGFLANLSEEVGNHIEMINKGVVPAIFTLSRAENKEIVQDSARTLANLSTNEHKQLPIHQQGAMSCLIHLSFSNVEDSIARRYISLAIQILSANMGVCDAILREKSINSLLELSSMSYLEYQRTAAAVTRAISRNENGKFELSQSTYLHRILHLCSKQDLHIKRDAACTIANIADCCDAHHNLVSGGAVQVMTKLSESCSDHFVVQEISRFFSFVTIFKEAKDKLCEVGIISTLVKYSRRSAVLTQRHATLALCNLCLSREHKYSILEQHGTLNTLIYLTRCPDLEVNRCTILALAALTLAANEPTKRNIVSAGAMKQISKFLQYPDIEIQQCASLALSCLVLGDGGEIKYKLNSEQNHLDSIFVLMNSSNEECVHHAVHILGSLMEVGSICDYLVKKGCIRSVAKIYDFASIEVKRACGYVFSILVEQEHYHESIYNASGLEKIVNLSALVDLECQLYGAFSLVFLASNKDFQVPLVKLGAVRPLVAMMANESQPRHYAGLALLKLADNFENHITIAEEGGIQALLKLGRSRAADEEVQYKAALTVGNLASKAADAAKKSRSDSFGAKKV